MSISTIHTLAMTSRYLLLIVTFCVAFVQHVLAQTELEKQFAAKVSEAQLRATVWELMPFGHRMGGTQHGERSAEYLAKKFKQHGLQVTVEEDRERLGFVHRRWELAVEEPRGMSGLIQNEWLAGFSPSVKTVRAQLVDADAEGGVTSERAQGKILLTKRAVTDRLYQEFVRLGAVCVLSYYPAREGMYPDWAFITNLRRSNENPIPVFLLSYNNGSALHRLLTEGKSVTMRFSTQTTMSAGVPRTVIATIPGEGDSYYIVCAHGDSDSGGPGADDNASGVAGLVELARVLQGMIMAKELPRPKHSIKFIVWADEYASTEQYVMRHAGRLDKIVGVMNYDQIGAGITRNCIYFESNDIPHNENLLRTLNAIGEEYAGMKGFWEEATTTPSQGGTDSYVFLPDYLKHLKLPAVEIPSVTIYTAAWNDVRTLPQTPGWSSRAWKGHPDSVVVDYSAYYHSSLDVPTLTTDKEPSNMVWAVKAAGIALLRLAW